MKPVGDKEILEWAGDISNDGIQTLPRVGVPMGSGMGPRDGSGPGCNPNHPLNKIIDPEVPTPDVIVKKIDLETEKPEEPELPRSDQDKQETIQKIKSLFSELSDLMGKL